MTEMIRIYCGVKFADKDMAKSRGAKWNMEQKLWYFSYHIETFFNDVNLHTFNYKPIRVEASLSKDYLIRTQWQLHKLLDVLYGISSNRYNEYMTTQTQSQTLPQPTNNIKIKMKTKAEKDIFIDEGECGVCLEIQDLHPGFYQCNHKFCKDCFKSWSKKTCPLCRSL
jgi:hypothetical protein